MTSMEERSRKHTKRVNLTRAILQTVQLAGVLAVAVIAPNTLSGLEKLGMMPSDRREESVHAARKRLLKAGFLAFNKGDVTLTEKGRRELSRQSLRSEQIPRPKKWDGKWRVLIFDIPNRRRGLRDRVRSLLKTHNFARLQNSVWAYPHGCEQFIALLKAELKVGREMQYLIVDSIENDAEIRAHFKLPAPTH